MLPLLACTSGLVVTQHTVLTKVCISFIVVFTHMLMALNFLDMAFSLDYCACWDLHPFFVTFIPIYLIGNIRNCLGTRIQRVLLPGSENRGTRTVLPLNMDHWGSELMTIHLLGRLAKFLHYLSWHVRSLFLFWLLKMQTEVEWQIGIHLK